MERSRKRAEKQLQQTIVMVETLLRMPNVPRTELLALASWLEGLGREELFKGLADQVSREKVTWEQMDAVISQSSVKELLQPIVDQLSERSRANRIRKELVVTVTRRFLENIKWKKSLEQERYMSRFFSSVEDTLSISHDIAMDAVIIDHASIVDSLELFKKLIKQMESAFVPVIIVGPNRSEIRQVSYEMGADDYWDETVPNEERHVRLARLLRKLRVVSSTILVDELTGAYNRKYLQNAFDRRVARLEREQRTFGLAIFDIDHFKRINDLHGHPTGDLVLSELATVVQQAARLDDEFIRFGGEEFILLFSAETLPQAVASMNKIRERVERHIFANGLRVTISIGLSFSFDLHTSLAQATAEADEALYQAKRNGRNQVVSYSTAISIEKIPVYIRVEQGLLKQVHTLDMPDHPKYHIEVIPLDDRRTTQLQLAILSLDQVVRENFVRLEEWRQQRESIIDILVVTDQEDDRLANALSCGATDYIMTSQIDSDMEEWITEWIMQIP
ncbi:MULTISPECIES: GGDEF domain-containing response regulator [unclassified Exiguobacterium]|uniref:GGDEF domain-containing response regulator n=1 Tax=unclassified Exiguobacterium TaxID=2644629 RepID=UPI00064746CD|nr:MULTISPECIES: diguanylate cyclase [unclassified Exiguobacterium]